MSTAGVAAAQDTEADADGEAAEEEAAEPAQYGDAELIEILTDYGLLDEWIAASPVSAEASLLSVSDGAYLAQRETFLNSLDTWALQTEKMRADQARIDATQAGVDTVRAAIIATHDALRADDRLRGPESKTLAVIATALDDIAAPDEHEAAPELAQEPLVRAEARLSDIRVRADAELQGLNRAEAAVTLSGVTAFAGFDALQGELVEVDQLLERSRELLRPARERGDQLVASTIALIPSLHSARMLGATDVAGLDVVTVDAYIRAAAGVPCAVDWALLAGIGKIESHHGRLGGASVSRTGQVSPQILGPLLDGGASDIAVDSSEEPADPDPLALLLRALRAPGPGRIANYVLGAAWGVRGDAEPDAVGNGFAVIVDSDGGRLDGNAEWDRAIGPMQFLPETWSRWAVDGNGDGVADPHNLYDATATAARFLCHLVDTRGSSPSSFLLGYNDSRSYARTVIATAQNLRSASLPTR